MQITWRSHPRFICVHSTGIQPSILLEVQERDRNLRQSCLKTEWKYSNSAGCRVILVVTFKFDKHTNDITLNGLDFPARIYTAPN
jgi:hypothetical protein